MNEPKKILRFPGSALPNELLNKPGVGKPLGEKRREEHERNVSREQCISVAQELTGRECWCAKRRVGSVKIRTLYVHQGEGEKALMFEGSDWWIVLRLLFSYLKNRGQLEIDEQGGSEVALT